MRYLFLLLLAITMTGSLSGQRAPANAFKIVPLGVRGGSDESSLSAYLVAKPGSDQYICLDAGTLHAGLEKAVAAGIFHGEAATVLRTNIKAYLISHPHLDHVSGLVMNAPDDTTKPIYGLSFCLETLKEKYFNWKSWANFANEGDKPTLDKYHYNYLASGVETEIPNTGLLVKAFALSHSNPFQSTAFLVRNGNDYLLYLGDTGADEIEKSDKLQLLWQEVAPLIKAGTLKGIFIEVSFPNSQPDKLLFGHLTPRLLMQEMKALAKLSGLDPLRQCSILVTHIKPNGSNEEAIKKQLLTENSLRLKLLFPRQARLIGL